MALEALTAASLNPLVAALLAVAGYLVAVVPRLAARSALAVSTVLAIALLAGGHLMLTEASLWVPCVLPVAALADLLAQSPGAGQPAKPAAPRSPAPAAASA